MIRNYYFKRDHPSQMKTTAYSILILLIVSLAGCAGFWPFGEEDGFVTVQGTHFVYNNRPYYFIGTNLWYGAYLGAPGPTGNRERLVRELDSLHVLHVNNLRVLAGSELSILAHAVSPVFTNAPGRYNNSLLNGLDFLLDEMAKRKMKAVLYLTNYWEWSGGMSRYIAWTDSTRSIDPEKDGWSSYMNFCASFYTNTKANALFHRYIAMLTKRKNTINGRLYADDPTIMAWQLANEPRPGSSMERASSMIPAFITWVDETAGYIKSLDTNHLVSSGSEGSIGCLERMDVYRSVHESKNIDYLTFHCWALNWKWYNPLYPDSTLPLSESNACNYINSHIECARLLHKPVVMEEFGIGRDSGSFSLSAPTTVRDRYYRRIFSIVYDSARAGSPISGCNFWAWGGEGRTTRTDFMWKPGDSFVGDPPQEPQGLNSVFDTDISTLTIIKSFARNMERIGAFDSLLSEVRK